MNIIIHGYHLLNISGRSLGAHPHITPLTPNIQNIGIMSITSNIFVRINGVFLKGIEKKSVTTPPPLILVTDRSLKVPQNKFNKKNYKRIIGV